MLKTESSVQKGKLRLAINGFGRTGRAATRIALENPLIEVVAINSKADAKNYAYLLKYDSLYGNYEKEIVAVDEQTITIDGKPLKVFAQDEEAMPWKDLNIDIVIESSGKFTKRDKAEVHLRDGAKRVIIGSPAKGDDGTFVMGVNEKTFDPQRHFIVSNASCTTNCLAPLAMILDKELGIEKGFMTTTHAYTNDQRLHDNSHKKDLRRARAATYSIIPTSTGAAAAIGLVLPQLKGKLDGVSLRVPVPVVSIIDLTVETRKKTSPEELNMLFKKYEKGELKGVLGTSDQPLVSVDFKGDSRSSIVDTELTQVIDGNLVKVFSWYDNEWGYASRVIDLALYIHNNS
mgnify:CR=1 FL=1